MTVDGKQVTLTEEDVESEPTPKEGYVAAWDRGYIVVIDTVLPDNLRQEGLARDLAHLIQDARKRSGFDIADWIQTEVWSDQDVARAATTFSEYIKRETLSKTLDAKIGLQPNATEGWHSEPVYLGPKLGGHSAVIRVRKADQ